MPQASSVSGDDYASNDEVKVYKDEGENEDEKRSENLNEEKLGLVTETEEGKSSDIEGQESFNSDDKSSVFLNRVKIPDLLIRDQFPFSYPLFHHYPYHTTSPLVSNNKLFPPPPPGLGFLMYGGNTDAITSPPPAHMGIPPLHIDLKTGLSRPPLYGLPSSVPSPSHHIYPPSAITSAEFPHLSVPPGSLHSPYSPPTLPGSPLSWFSSSAIFPHNFHFNHPSSFHHFNHPSNRHLNHELSPLSESIEHSRNAPQSSSHQGTPVFPSNHHQPHRTQSHKLYNTTSNSDKRRSYVKKPLNAFMLFMKEMRQKVIEECTLKESAAINQILGRKWHALDRSDQAKYYEMAKKEKETHMQQYPGWSARDNYATHTKKKKKREGLEQDSQINKKLRLQFNPMEPSSTINDSSLGPPSLVTNDNQHHSDVSN